MYIDRDQKEPWKKEQREILSNGKCFLSLLLLLHFTNINH